MLPSFEGVYRNGKIELIEMPANVNGEKRVIVTFLEPQHIDLQSRGINKSHAAELRARLATFAEDWDSPEMKLYDNYETTKSKL
ncbi:hypothetical protein H8E88_20965 [candidate division KSB1 bacterium]|nr:hypothetical protein [candidate division KSB1 bacterium]MBL7092334.1 hypothetical protein [candidate division KSB1 bacterium]